MELLELDDGVIFGGQVMAVPMNWHHSDGISFAPIKLGENTFCANFSLLQAGTVLPERCILGLLSTLEPFSECEPNATYMGSPALRVASSREDDEQQTLLLQSLLRDEAEFEDKGTAHRCVVMLCSCAMPMLSLTFFSLLAGGIYYGTTEIIQALQIQNIVAQFFVLVLTTVTVLVVELLLAAGIKRCCCPVFKGRHIVWSYAFLAWMLFGSVISLLSSTILSNVQGTALMSLWLRMLGATVGDGVYFDTVPPTETDCLLIEDGASVLEAPQSLVPHSIDRGMLQFSRIRIGKNASVGINACLNLHTDVGDNSSIAPLSVVMKAEVVPSNSYGQGNPLVVTDTAPLGYLSPEDITRGLSNGCECRDCCQRLSVACPCWAAHSGYTQLYDEEDIADGIPLQGVRLYGATVGLEESPKSDL